MLIISQHHLFFDLQPLIFAPKFQRGIYRLLIASDKAHSAKPKRMKVQQIAELLNTKIICGAQHSDKEVDTAFASDLMSDVLTLKNDNIILITGLANTQTLRTAEMANISVVILARGKNFSPEMLELAEENDLILMECEYSVFRTSGLLYQAGIKPVF